MVMCIVIDCSKRFGRDRDVSFYRIPKVNFKKVLDTWSSAENAGPGFWQLFLGMV